MTFMQGREVTPANLKAKVLCVTHNSALHELDDEAIRLANALRVLLAAKQQGNNAVRVDGWKIERWCMKCGCNVLASGWAEGHGFAPDPQIVRAIFGVCRLPSGAGLYGLLDPMVKLISDADQVGFTLFERSPAAIVGVYIQMHGLGLIVSSYTGDITAALRGAKNLGNVPTPDWSAARVMHHPHSVELFRNLAPGEKASLTLEFAW